MRYAHQWAHHGEVVYNLGERVEGYTNFLWVAILAGVIKLGGAAPAGAQPAAAVSGWDTGSVTNMVGSTRLRPPSTLCAGSAHPDARLPCGRSVLRQPVQRRHLGLEYEQRHHHVTQYAPPPTQHALRRIRTS